MVHHHHTSIQPEKLLLFLVSIEDILTKIDQEPVTDEFIHSQKKN